ncbi:hypothetical protein K474DRAFT_1667533 [Panus rudis PR-1116 ss-1]|nr:hypothetical protein K474DRAFT_1667533 [Panus rudis PR-1116 ss-1]
MRGDIEEKKYPRMPKVGGGYCSYCLISPAAVTSCDCHGVLQRCAHYPSLSGCSDLFAARSYMYPALPDILSSRLLAELGLFRLQKVRVTSGARFDVSAG